MTGPWAYRGKVARSLDVVAVGASYGTVVNITNAVWSGKYDEVEPTPANVPFAPTHQHKAT